MGEYEKSLDACSMALEKKPGDFRSRANLGLALLLSGAYDDAKLEYVQAIDYAKYPDIIRRAIKDLWASLENRPGLPGAQDILDMLEGARRRLKADFGDAAGRGKKLLKMSIWWQNHQKI